MTDIQFFRSLWTGSKVIDDPRVATYIVVSPNGHWLRTMARARVDQMLQDGLLQRVRFCGVRDKDQPGLVLTDDGLRAIGKPTKAESTQVVVTGPDIRRVRGKR